MSMSFNFVAAGAEADATALRKALVLEHSFEAWPPRPADGLCAPGLSLSVRPFDPQPAMRAWAMELLGFVPTVMAHFMPAISGPHFEAGMRNMMAAVALLFRHTAGDAALTVELERVLVLRKAGRHLMRDDIDQYLQAYRFEPLGVEFERRPLRP